MPSHRRLLEISFLAMVCVSATLLGFGQGNISLTFIAIGLSLLGLTLVDWLQVFSLPRWVANVLSIVVLIFTMRGFFGDQSGAQLIAVANLLIYLQSLLMLQEKTPRQYWQLVVLNLLQIVVAAVFVLNLEGGLLFLLYMLCAALFLCLLTSYDEEFRLKQINEKGQDGFSLFDFFQSNQRGSRSIRMTYEVQPLTTDFYRTAASHLAVWMFVSLAFSMVLFVLIPRHQVAWFAGTFQQVSRTGATKAVDLDERGRILLNTDPVMRVRFKNPITKDVIQFDENPYFRGMALGSLVIRDNKTTFEAPYDRVYQHHFEPLNFPSRRELTTPFKTAILDVTMTPTADPLMYGVMPALGMPGENSPAEMCQPLSALTRRRNADQIELTPFQYLLVTRLGEDRQPLSAWPYEPESSIPSAQTMAGNQGEFKWLTQMEPERYPQLVNRAAELATEANSTSHIAIARAMESHFWNGNLYQYTLDYTTVPRDERLDPIEDFVRNHRRGHCELFASALVLMLRSQGIPARLVVGYCGGDWVDDFYSVTNANAHAWVEAYIRPEDCTAKMFAQREAGPGGCWLRLDPTPSAELFASNREGGNSLVLARSLWQDYVLGLNQNNQGDFMTSPSTSLLGLMDIGNWSAYVQGSVDSIQRNPGMQAGVILLAIVILVLSTVVTFRPMKRNRLAKPSGKKVGLVRRLAAQALALFSPELGNWMLRQGRDSLRVPFYEQLRSLLKRYGVERKEAETSRDLKEKAVKRFSEAGNSPRIEQALDSLTEGFQQIRFGNQQLDDRSSRKFESEVRDLEGLLNESETVRG